MSFVRRRIDVTVSLGTGDFGEGPAGKANTVTAKDLRVSASIVKAGLPSWDTAEIRVWGLTQSVMNHVTDLGKPLSRMRNNTVRVLAGDEGGAMAEVFFGVIQTAYNDFSDPPDACVNFTCSGGLIAQTKPVDPISVQGSADVVVLMQQIAAAMGKGFKNSGVTGIQLSNPYYPGTAAEQMVKVAQAANIWADANGDILEIWPKEAVRGALGPLISPASGLQGYPQYTDEGISLRSIYAPGILFGSRFKLESVITPANGLWDVARVVYELESEVYGGRWDMQINARRPLDGTPQASQ